MEEKGGMWNTTEGIKGRSVTKSKRQLYRKEIWEATDLWKKNTSREGAETRNTISSLEPWVEASFRR